MCVSVQSVCVYTLSGIIGSTLVLSTGGMSPLYKMHTLICKSIILTSEEVADIKYNKIGEWEAGCCSGSVKYPCVVKLLFN